MKAEDIFHSALDLESPHERQAYVEKACRGDEPQRRLVEDLLKQHFDTTPQFRLVRANPVEKRRPLVGTVLFDSLQ